MSQSEWAMWVMGIVTGSVGIFGVRDFIRDVRDSWAEVKAERARKRGKPAVAEAGTCAHGATIGATCLQCSQLQRLLDGHKVKSLIDLPIRIPEYFEGTIVDVWLEKRGEQIVPKLIVEGRDDIRGKA